MKHKLISVIIMFIGILVAIGPHFIFPVCKVTSDMVMRCHYTAEMSIGLGLALIGLGILNFISQSIEFSKGLYCALSIFGALIIATPTVLIGVCDSPMMHCHTTTRPVLILLGIIVIILSVIGYFFLRSTRYEK